MLVTACASTGARPPWWRQTGVSACGRPALMAAPLQLTAVRSGAHHYQ